jgi:hypothetical protein
MAACPWEVPWIWHQACLYSTLGCLNLAYWKVFSISVQLSITEHHGQRASQGRNFHEGIYAEILQKPIISVPNDLLPDPTVILQVSNF